MEMPKKLPKRWTMPFMVFFGLFAAYAMPQIFSAIFEWSRETMFSWTIHTVFSHLLNL